MISHSSRARRFIELSLATSLCVPAVIAPRLVHADEIRSARAARINVVEGHALKLPLSPNSRFKVETGNRLLRAERQGETLQISALSSGEARLVIASETGTQRYAVRVRLLFRCGAT